MAVLKNVEINWVKLDQDNPDMGFDGESPTWQVTATVDKKFFNSWRKQKLPSAKEHDDGTYTIQFKRKAIVVNGKMKSAPKCLDASLRPLDQSIVGNGSIANIQYSVYDWDFGKKKGKAADLMGIQVIDLVEYHGGDGSEFEVVSEDSNELSADDDDDDNPLPDVDDDDDGDIY